MPIRLWYRGNTFINNSNYQGRLKESTQLGAELIGDDSVDADAEIIALVINALKTAGLREFQVTIGHVDFLKGLVEAAGLDEETTEELSNLISNKNFFGVEELVSPLAMEAELKELFRHLGDIYENAKDLSGALELSADYPVIRASVERLCSLYELLEVYGVSDYVSMEPGMNSSYRYYTGIIFAGYTFGSGEPIVKGGRYDDLLPYFGKQAPSIGFAVVVDQLMAALSRQKIRIPVQERCRLLVYEADKRTEAIAMAARLRGEGEEVLLTGWQKGKTRENYLEYAQRFRCVEVIFLTAEDVGMACETIRETPVYEEENSARIEKGACI